MVKLIPFVNVGGGYCLPLWYSNPIVAFTTTSAYRAVQRHQSPERPILRQISSQKYPTIQ